MLGNAANPAVRRVSTLGYLDSYRAIRLRVARPGRRLRQPVDTDAVLILAVLAAVLPPDVLERLVTPPWGRHSPWRAKRSATSGSCPPRRTGRSARRARANAWSIASCAATKTSCTSQ